MTVVVLTAPGGNSRVRRPFAVVSTPPAGPISTLSVIAVAVGVRVAGTLGDGETLGVAVSGAAGVTVDALVGTAGTVGDAGAAVGAATVGVAVLDGEGDDETRVVVAEAVTAGVWVRVLVAVGTMG